MEVGDEYEESYPEGSEEEEFFPTALPQECVGDDPGENLNPPKLTNPVPAMFGDDRSAEAAEISDKDDGSSVSSTLVGMEETFRQQAENERRLAENRHLLDSAEDDSSYEARLSESDNSFSSVSSGEDSGNAEEAGGGRYPGRVRNAPVLYGQEYPGTRPGTLRSNRPLSFATSVRPYVSVLGN